jgi:hypothetical protein
MYCLIADIKTRLGITTSTEWDTLLTGIVTGVSGMFDREIKRPLFVTAADVTEYVTGGCDLIQLMRYPINGTITSIKETYGDYDFANATALVANTDYRILTPGEYDRGLIKRLYAAWPGALNCIEVKYKGGFCAAGVTPSTGQYVLPGELREAAIEQCSLLFKRRDDIGLSSQSFQGGSLNVFSKLELEPLVKQTLGHYARKSL